MRRCRLAGAFHYTAGLRARRTNIVKQAYLSDAYGFCMVLCILHNVKSTGKHDEKKFKKFLLSI